MYYQMIVQTHAYALTVALACFLIAEVLLFAARSGRVMSARAALAANGIGGLLAGVGIIAGIGLVIAGPWPLRSPWLIASFPVIALLMAIEHRLVRPWEARLKMTLRGEPTATDIEALATEKSAFTGRIVMICLFALIMVVMSAKPGFSAFF